jgi:hypothetical protein
MLGGCTRHLEVPTVGRLLGYLPPPRTRPRRIVEFVDDPLLERDDL